MMRKALPAFLLALTIPAAARADCGSLIVEVGDYLVAGYPQRAEAILTTNDARGPTATFALNLPLKALGPFSTLCVQPPQTVCPPPSFRPYQLVSPYGAEFSSAQTSTGAEADAGAADGRRPFSGAATPVTIRLEEGPPARLIVERGYGSTPAAATPTCEGDVMVGTFDDGTAFSLSVTKLP